MDESTHRELATERDAPAAQIAEIVADLEGVAPDTLTPVWDSTNHVIAHMFSTPPSTEAEMEVTFTYEGYRIAVEQDGTAQLVQQG